MLPSRVKLIEGISAFPFISDTHTVVVHPTKGLRAISHKRYAAQTAMASVLDNIIRRARRRPKYPNVYVFQKCKPPVKALSVVTRQQRRYAQRKGLPVPE